MSRQVRIPLFTIITGGFRRKGCRIVDRSRLYCLTEECIMYNNLFRRDIERFHRIRLADIQNLLILQIQRKQGVDTSRAAGISYPADDAMQLLVRRISVSLTSAQGLSINKAGIPGSGGILLLLHCYTQPSTSRQVLLINWRVQYTQQIC